MPHLNCKLQVLELIGKRPIGGTMHRVMTSVEGNEQLMFRVGALYLDWARGL